MAKRRAKTRRSQSEAERAREAHWRKILGEQTTSGLSHSAFCRKKKISANAYFWWKREILVRDKRRRRSSRKDSDDKPKLVPVRIRAPEFVGYRSESFEVVLSSDRVVRVPAGFDPESLKRLLAVLEDGAC